MSDLIDRQILKADLLCGDNAEHDYCFPCKEILERIDNQPSAETHDKRTEMHSCDWVSRQVAIDALAKHEKSKGHNYTMFADVVSECAEIIRDLPSAQSTMGQQNDGDTINKLERCRFEYLNACKTVTFPTPDTSKSDIYDAYAVIKALHPIFGDVEF